MWIKIISSTSSAYPKQYINLSKIKLFNSYTNSNGFFIEMDFSENHRIKLKYHKLEQRDLVLKFIEQSVVGDLEFPPWEFDEKEEFKKLDDIERMKKVGNLL